MPKEKSPHDLWDNEQHLSGAAEAVNRQINMIRGYGITEKIEEIESYFQELNKGKKRRNIPERSVIITSDPLRIDEQSYLRHKLSKLYKTDSFEWMKRWKETTMQVQLLLSYNKNIPVIENTSEGEGKIIYNTEDIVSVSLFPMGFAVAHEKVLDENAQETKVHLIPTEELNSDPEMLEDALWDVFWSNPPIRI